MLPNMVVEALPEPYALGGFTNNNKHMNKYNTIHHFKAYSCLWNSVRSRVLWSVLTFNVPVSGFNVPVNKRFGSTSLPFHTPDKLFINSTFDNINFDKNKSVLLLPSLYAEIPDLDRKEIMDHKYILSKYHTDLDQESLLFRQLDSIIKNLVERGEYTFEFYFYAEAMSPSKPVKDIYTFNENKSCLIKLDKGNSGYKSIVKVPVYIIPDKYIPYQFILTQISEYIGDALKTLESVSDFRIFDYDEEKEILLVIVHNNPSKPYNSNLLTTNNNKQVTLNNKRFYSTNEKMALPSIKTVFSTTLVSNGALKNKQLEEMDEDILNNLYSYAGDDDDPYRDYLESINKEEDVTVDIYSKVRSKERLHKTNFKNFKYNSPIYNSLNLMLKDKPINEETQRKIEKVLLNYSYIALNLDNKESHNFNIDYSKINTELAKLLMKEQESLLKLISNFKQDLSDRKINTQNNNIDQELLSLEDINQIFQIIPNKYLITVMLGRTLKILSHHQESKNNFNSVVEVGYDLGKDIINHYCYLSFLIKKKRSREQSWILFIYMKKGKYWIYFKIWGFYFSIWTRYYFNRLNDDLWFIT